MKNNESPQNSPSEIKNITMPVSQTTKMEPLTLQAMGSGFTDMEKILQHVSNTREQEENLGKNIVSFTLFLKLIFKSKKRF